VLPTLHDLAGIAPAPILVAHTCPVRGEVRRFVAPWRRRSDTNVARRRVAAVREFTGGDEVATYRWANATVAVVQSRRGAAPPRGGIGRILGGVVYVLFSNGEATSRVAATRFDGHWTVTETTGAWCEPECHVVDADSQVGRMLDIMEASSREVMLVEVGRSYRPSGLKKNDSAERDSFNQPAHHLGARAERAKCEWSRPRSMAA